MPKTQKQCEMIRENMKNKILRESMLYFARNGFAGTKISDLAKNIGIAQGTIYLYFSSKEALFEEIYRHVSNTREIQELKLLTASPLSGKQKIQLISKKITENLQEESYAAKVALNAQLMLGSSNYDSEKSMYSSALYQHTEKLIEQSQKEGTGVSGSPEKLCDLYWGVVYIYALKRLFTSSYEGIGPEDLGRILLRDSL